MTGLSVNWAVLGDFLSSDAILYTTIVSLFAGFTVRKEIGKMLRLAPVLVIGLAFLGTVVERLWGDSQEAFATVFLQFGVLGAFSVACFILVGLIYRCAVEWRDALDASREPIRKGDLR